MLMSETGRASPSESDKVTLPFANNGSTESGCAEGTGGVVVTMGDVTVDEDVVGTGADGTGGTAGAGGTVMIAGPSAVTFSGSTDVGANGGNGAGSS